MKRALVAVCGLVPFGVLAVAAPFLLSDLYLSSYLLPGVIWATAALGLNLLMGWAGQIHLGYAAVMAIASTDGSADRIS